MSGYRCPFCGNIMSLINGSNYKTNYISNQGAIFNREALLGVKIDYCFKVTTYLCPSCEKMSIHIENDSYPPEGLNRMVYPLSSAKQFPDYIPLSIRQDYEEAYAIFPYSPKAAAALCRRCLQGMIRDFFKVNARTLKEEIEAIREKVTPAQWRAIDAVRNIGNIGAHMEKDVNLIIEISEDEAKPLLQLIELLLEKWYVARNDEQLLCEQISKTAARIKEEKTTP